MFQKYDIRGRLSDDFVQELGDSFASKYGSVVVMTDPKESSKRLARFFCNGVNKAGYDVIHCGIGPTDMCSIAGQHFKLPSVMFTASHLSDEKDGIKFHDSEGIPFSPEMIANLRDLKPVIASIKGIVKKKDFSKKYFDQLLTRYHELFDHQLTGLRVLVDLKNGCGITHELLKRLGAVVKVFHSNGSNPSNGGLEELSKRSRNHDLVIVHDFDADRVVIVNERGVIHGSRIACILTKVFKGLVIASIDSSQLLSKYTKVSFSKVGDPFVSRAIKVNGACLGVEPSGHYTDPLFCPTSSGSLFALIIAGLVYEKSLDKLLKDIPKVNIKNAVLNVRDKSLFMKQVKSKVTSLISDVDGVKFEFQSGIALIRPSGTEPIIRFHLENDGSVEDLVRWAKP